MTRHNERREKTKLVKQEPAPCFGADAMLRHNCLEEHMPMSTFLNASPIFGPVRSRRLGLSLGVNMMPASGKICTFDCIYCENGLNAERPCHEPYNTAAVVLDALEAKLRDMAAEGELPDVITFAGPPSHRSFRRPSPVPSRFATSWPQTPRLPCSPTARAPTAPRYTMRS